MFQSRAVWFIIGFMIANTLWWITTKGRKYLAKLRPCPACEGNGFVPLNKKAIYDGEEAQKDSSGS